MKVLGIVAEYNPFHNGHLYHLQTSREQSGADCIVAVMSGNFTQRGEPAVVDKWARTEMALLNGVDLVIELPCAYAMASAEYFAYGAVRILDALGTVDLLSFGSEAGILEALDFAATIFMEEPDEYKLSLKRALSSGKSFPAARQLALSEYLNQKNGQDCCTDILNNPNNILGIEYLKALRRLSSRIQPMTVERRGSAYNACELSGRFSSATSIRRILSEKSWPEARELLTPTLPDPSLAILERELELGRGPVFAADYEMLLLSSLRSMTEDELRSLPYMEEGLENRLKQAAGSSGTFEELLASVCTRRYTGTRIRRILFSLITGLRKSSFEAFNSAGGPSYIRILGFNDTGRKLLSESRELCTLPLITKAADFKYSLENNTAAMLRLEAAADDRYVLACKNAAWRKSGSDFTRNIIYV